MTPMKFEIILDNERAISFLLGAIEGIVKHGDFVKVKISKLEGEQEWVKSRSCAKN